MAKSLKSSSPKSSATSRKEYLTKVASTVLSQTTKAYGISSNSKKSSSIKVSPTMSAAAASKVLRDGSFGNEKKSIAGSVLAKSKTKTSKSKPKKVK